LVNILFSSQWERLSTAPTTSDQYGLYGAQGTTDDPYVDVVAETPWLYVGRGTSVEATATSHILTEPAGVAAGDLLVACIGSRIASTTQITLPSGWTRVSQQLNNNTSTNTSATPSGMMAYIVRGASAPSYTFTHPVAPSVALGRVFAYRNVNQTTPFDVSYSTTTATGLTIVTAITGPTTTQDYDLAVAMWAGGQEGTYTGFVANDVATSGTTTDSVLDPLLNGWLERSDILTTTGADTSLAVYDGVKGVVGTGFFNVGITSSLAAAHVLVMGCFKLAPSGPPTSTGTVNVTLDALTLAATGEVTTPLNTGSLNTTLGALTSTATAKVLVQGQYGLTPTAPTSRQLTSFTPVYYRNDWFGEVGFLFSVSSNLTVNWLAKTTGTGNTGINKVNLRVAATATLLGSASIDMTGRSAGSYAWGSIAPVTLVPGTTYALVTETTAVDADSFAGEEATTFASPITSVISAYNSAVGTGFNTQAANSQFGGLDLGSGPVAAPTLDALTLSASGLVFDPLPVISGTLNTTLGALTMASTAKALAKGTLNTTLGALTLASSGTVANQVFTGTLSTTLGSLTLVATAKALASGSLNTTLGALTLASSGKALVQGTLGTTLGALTLSASGTVFTPSAGTVTGTLSVTLDALTLAATGRQVATGTLNTTLGALALSATANALAKGTLGTTLGALTMTGTAKVLVKGTLGTTLDALTISASGTVFTPSAGTVTGTLNATLGALTLSANGVVLPAITGTLNTTLGALALTSTGIVANPITGGTMRLWNGSAWVNKPAKVWTGSAWMLKPAKIWNGSAWV